MKLKFSLVILLTTIFYGLSAQSTFSGKVLDASGKPIEGASCILKEINQGVATDASGEFKFENLEDKEYHLLVTHIAYQNLEAKIIVPNQDFKIVLEEDYYMAEDIQVIATRFGEKTPMTYTNIDRELIKRNSNGQEITKLLSLTPSIIFNSESGYGLGNSSIRVRGTDPTRVNVTIDGVPLNDAESHGVFWVNMPDFGSSVDNIQIQRGVGNSSNGAASFGASINFQTDKLKKKAYAEIDYGIGSFDTETKSYKAGTGLINDHYIFNFRYSNFDSDGYVDRSFVDHKSLFLSGAYVSEKTIIKAKIMLGDQVTGITWWGNSKFKTNRKYNDAGEKRTPSGAVSFYDNQTDNYKQNHYSLNISHFFSDDFKLSLTPYIITGKGHYEQYIDKEVANKGIKYGGGHKIGDYIKNYSGSVASTDIIRQKHLDNRTVGFNLNSSYKLNNLSTSFGLGANHYDGDHFGILKWLEHNDGSVPNDYQWYKNNGKKDDANTFLKVNYALNSKLNLYTDLQYRYIKYEISGFDDDLIELKYDKDFNFFNPKLGLNFTLNKFSNLYGSFAVANREPARADIKEASKGGNVFPTHETLYDYELGYKLSSENLAFSINLYYMMYKDQLVNTGEKNSVGYDLMTNVDDSYRSGIEVAANYEMNKFLSFNLNFTYSQNKIEDYKQTISVYDAGWANKRKVVKNYGDVTTSFSPDIVSNAAILVKPIENLDIQLKAKYVSEQYFDNTESDDRKIDAYFVNDLDISYNLAAISLKAVTLTASVYNIFDHEYETHAYGGFSEVGGKEENWMYYFPQAPANFMFKANIKF